MKSKIKQLIKLVEESNINEIEVSSFWGGQKIRVTKSKENENVQPLIMQQPSIQAPQLNIQSELEEKEIKKMHVKRKLSYSWRSDSFLNRAKKTFTFQLSVFHFSTTTTKSTFFGSALH